MVTVLLAAVPSWVLGVAGLLAVVSAYWWLRERSASGVARRSRRSSRKAAAGTGGVLVGIVGALVGLSSGLADTLGLVGDVAAQSPGVVTQIALAGAGWFAVSSGMSATTFAAVAGAIMLIGIMVSR